MIQAIKNLFTKNQSQQRDFWYDSRGNLIDPATGKGIFFGDDEFQTSFEQIVQEGFARSPWLYIVVDRIAKGCMSMPCEWLTIDGEPINGRVRALGRVGEVQRLLSDPMLLFNGWSFKEIVYRIVSQYLLTGNGFLVGFPFTENATIRYNNIIPPLTYNVDPNQTGDAVIKNWTVNYFDKSYIVADKDLMQMGLPNPTDDDNLSFAPGSALVNIWKANKYLNANDQSTHKNKGVNGILHVKGERPLLENERQAIDNVLNDSMTRRDKVGKYHYSPREMGYSDVAKSFKDLQADKSSDRHREIIASAYNYPVQLLNDTASSTYNNVREIQKTAYVNAVIPVYNYFLESFNDWLVRGNYGLQTIKLGFREENVPELQLINAERTDDNKKKQDMVLNVNRTISIGEMSRQEGINLLTLTGFTQEEAESVVTNGQRRN